MNKKGLSMSFVVKLLIVLSVILIMVFFVSNSIPRQFKFWDDEEEDEPPDYDGNKLNIMKAELSYGEYGSGMGVANYYPFIGSSNAKDMWFYHDNPPLGLFPKEFNSLYIYLDGKMVEDAVKNIEDYVDVFVDNTVSRRVPEKEEDWKPYSQWVKDKPAEVKPLIMIVEQGSAIEGSEIRIGNIRFDYYIMVELKYDEKTKKGLKSTLGRTLNLDRAVIQFKG